MKRKAGFMLLAYLVVAAIIAVALIGGAGGAANVARETEEFDKLAKDPDAGNEKAGVGNREEGDRGPLSADEEDYLNRAYPADEIPMQLTLNAQAAFNSVKARGVGQGKNNPGQWVLIGPSRATYPGVLNQFLGGGAQYITSGRITAMAIAPTCTASQCRLWLGAAGGGIWRTDKALSGNPGWTFISGSFGTNAIGTLTLDPTDPTGNTLYAGTGEPNASGDSEAGLGIYKSTDGGNTWTKLAAATTVGTYSGPAFDGRAIGRIVVDPTNSNVLYVASARGVRGISSVTGGATSNPPIAAPFGLYKSTDGGATFSFIWNGNASIRGVIDAELDPTDPSIVYSSAFQQGIWRSSDGGATWERVFAPTAPAFNTNRTMFAMTVANGKVRIYAGDGAQGAPPASFWRVDDAHVSAATLTSGGVNIGWKNLTSGTPGNPYYGTFNYCTGQCWYDNDVFTPAGYPDVVYLLGSFAYGELGGISNGRGLVLSTDAGETFTDMTQDASPNHPDALHPDHHEMVVNPNDPYQFFDGSDGGIVRSDGTFGDASAKCDERGLSGGVLTTCKQLLSRVPGDLSSMNEGLSTLQFQSLSVNPQRPQNSLQGGTQDNGTFEFTGSTGVWWQEIYGDGGQSGFSAADDALRFNTFTGQASDVNFRNGDPTKWVIATGPIVSSPEGSNFYPPIIGDPNPAAGGTIFQGSQSVWRTQDWGGDRDYLEANCPEFTTSAADPSCGDFVRIGPAGATDLTANAADYRGGSSRAGGVLAAIERVASDTGTLWAATTTGRVFISKNADAAAGSVTYTRLDTLAANDPQRFVSSIYIDPADPNHAWISYSGYNFNTPAQPGHVFEVTYNPGAGTATWTNLDGGTGPLGDLPVTDLVRDDVTGDLYAATDFGVLRLPNGSSTWVMAGTGMPMVEVPGLTIVPSARILYAATHGRSAWRLQLP